jgi:hypothetical protein
MYSVNMFAADMKSTYMLGVGSSEFLPKFLYLAQTECETWKRKRLETTELG